jgi:ammonia channel protein AmtB
VTPTIYFLDRFLAVDPLAIIGVHGVAGLIGTLAAAPLGGEDTSLLPQLLLIIVVPLASVAIAVLVVVVCGLGKLLFFDRSLQSENA